MTKKELKKGYQQYLYNSKNDELISPSKKACELISRIAPKKLYKYRLYNDYAVKNLKSNTLWLSSPQYFNDPYDFKPYISSKSLWQNYLCNDEAKELLEKYNILCTDKQVEKFTNSTLKPLIEIKKKNIELSFEKFRRNICICSLSEEKDLLLMWAHYTDCHKGFCIEYDFNDMRNHLKGLLQPVLYNNEVIDIAQYYKNNENGCLISILNKSEEWVNENEWRIIARDNSSKGRNISVPKPTAIYMGCKIDKVYKSELIKIADELNIKKFVMEMKEDEFKLVPKRI